MWRDVPPAQHQNFEESQEAMKQQLLQLSVLLRALDPELCDFLGGCSPVWMGGVEASAAMLTFCPLSPSDSQDSGSLCFCFRWLLIWFKREFSFEDILLLWEVRERRAASAASGPHLTSLTSLTSSTGPLDSSPV